MPFCQSCGEPCFKPPCPCGSGEKPKLNQNFADEEQPNHSNAYLSGGITGGNNAVDGLKKAAGLNDAEYQKMSNMAHTSQVAKPVQTKRKVTVHDTGVSPTCDKCQKPIGGQGVHALGGAYHAECLRCSNCHVLISGAFNQRDGELWCRPCYEQIRAEKQARLDELNAQKAEREAVLAPSTAGAGPGAAANEPCVVCGHVLGTARCVRSMDQVYHEDCFEQSTNAPTRVPVASNAGVCELCRQDLGSAFVKANGQRFHKDCFRCRDCQQLLQGQFAMVDGVFKCGTCATSRRVVAQPGRTGRGFTIDPITGQKRYM